MKSTRALSLTSLSFAAIIGMSAIVSVSGAGCLGDPAPPDGTIACSPQGQACPEYYQCLMGFCYLDGHMPAAGKPDATTCTAYCNCIGDSCSSAPGTFSDEGACQRACLALSPDAFSCRKFHCGLAKSNPSVHCPHALGQAVCK